MEGELSVPWGLPQRIKEGECCSLFLAAAAFMGPIIAESGQGSQASTGCRGTARGRGDARFSRMASASTAVSRLWMTFCAAKGTRTRTVNSITPVASHDAKDQDAGE